MNARSAPKDSPIIITYGAVAKGQQHLLTQLLGTTTSACAIDNNVAG